MWLFTKYGFFSVVCAHGDKPGEVDRNWMMIRARDREHLVALLGFAKPLGIFENKAPKIAHTTDTDYAYRIVVAWTEWVALSGQLAMSIDYNNFKSAVAAHSGKDAYERSLHEVWQTMSELQDTRPYSGGITSRVARPKVYECEESVTGKHVFSPDLEYDPSGVVVNCEYCGVLKPEPALKKPGKRAKKGGRFPGIHDLKAKP